MFIIEIQDCDIILDGQFTARSSAPRTPRPRRLHSRIIELETILSDIYIAGAVHFVDNVDGVVDAAGVGEAGAGVWCVAADEASWSSCSWLNHVD